MAVELFSEASSRSVTSAQIARRAGVAVATVHNHFGSRPALLAACRAHLESLAPTLESGIFAGQDRLAGRLAALVQAVFARHASTAAAMRWATAEAMTVPDLGAYLEGARAERVRLIVQAMAPGFDGSPPASMIALAAALLDFPAWSSLADDLGAPEAEDAVVSALTTLARRR